MPAPLSKKALANLVELEKMLRRVARQNPDDPKAKDEARMATIRRKEQAARIAASESKERQRRIWKREEVVTDFISWLRTARITDDRIGDLIADARDDRFLPQRVSSKEEFVDYLRNRPGDSCREARAIVPWAWRRFKLAKIKKTAR